MKQKIDFIVIDLFCGFGGTTLGYVKAGNAKVVACINHDPKAIKSHWFNHPEVKHFEEDIRTLKLSPLIEHVNNQRTLYPDAKIILWASLECTNFSKAKGGMSRDADSRTLADHLFRYVHTLNPDYIKIENVVEFMQWGPLEVKVSKTDEGFDFCPLYVKKGKKSIYNEIRPIMVPVKNKLGIYFDRWCKKMENEGYTQKWKELNSANFGAYTSRNRLFGCFAKKGLPSVFPEPTHSKTTSVANLFKNALKPWMPVREVLHLDQEGESIFNRKKPLVDKTLERIYSGLVKFVAGGDITILNSYFPGFHSKKLSKTSLSEKDKKFILKYNSTQKSGEVSSGHSINQPSPVIATQNRLSIVTAKFLDVVYGNGFPSSINMPAPTLRTKDGLGLITATQFIKRDFTNGGESQSINVPAGSVTSNPKLDLVTVKPFIMDTQFNNGAKSINEPLGVITANRKHHYIVNPSYFGHSHSIEGPCPVIVARQDKAPLAIVNTVAGNPLVKISNRDSLIMIKIKQFMIVYGISDIRMRMLQVPELLKIQGFPETYKMFGSQTDAKKFIGNSVVPLVVENWSIALGNSINYTTMNTQLKSA